MNLHISTGAELSPAMASPEIAPGPTYTKVIAEVAQNVGREDVLRNPSGVETALIAGGLALAVALGTILNKSKKR